MFSSKQLLSSTLSYAFLTFTFFIVAPPVQAMDSSPCGVEQESTRLYQNKNFYDGLAVLAENNLEKFFIPRFQKGIHNSLFMEPPQAVTSVPWWTQSGVVPAVQVAAITYTTVDAPEELQEVEMRELLELRSSDKAQMSMDEVLQQMTLERKLHRWLFEEHQQGLETYQMWAFENFSPLRAYQRILENFVSSSVWWNHYVVEYASTMSDLFAEQAARANCEIGGEGVLWTSFVDDSESH